LVPYWAKDIKTGVRCINAMLETVATKPAFREAFQRRRRLVPADYFHQYGALSPRLDDHYAACGRMRFPAIISRNKFGGLN
jgi:putative SOS response-associated peptidase YedK